MDLQESLHTASSICDRGRRYVIKSIFTNFGWEKKNTINFSVELQV